MNESEPIRLYRVRYKVQYGSVEETGTKSEIKEIVKSNKKRGAVILKLWNLVTGKVYYQKKRAKGPLKPK